MEGKGILKVCLITQITKTDYTDWRYKVDMTERPRNPIPTVDIIIEVEIPPIPPFSKGGEGGLGIVLIERKNPPYGWALPGGFVDYGESLEDAATREAEEETSLKVRLKGQLHTYSDPNRDPRFHTISTVFIASAEGTPKARDDAKGIGVFRENSLPHPLAFDHETILKDYFEWKRYGLI